MGNLSNLKSQTYDLIIENLNLKEINTLPKECLQELNEIGEHYSEAFKYTIAYFTKAEPEIRVKFYYDLIQNSKTRIEEYKLKAFPLNIQYLSFIPQFMEDMIALNQGTPIEILQLHGLKAEIEQIKVLTGIEIQKIEKLQAKKGELYIHSDFVELFESVSSYNDLMEILITQQLIAPITYLWIDEKGGNKYFLVSIIKNLKGKKYLKSNVKLTPKLIRHICLNHFGVDLSISLINQHKTPKTNDKSLIFIPIYSLRK